MWDRFHRRPTTYTGDVAAELAWLESFRAGIPNGCACKCQAHWTDLEAANPPELTDGPSLALWGFQMHNLVNRSIGKPELAWEAAMGLWGWPDDWDCPADVSG